MNLSTGPRVIQIMPAEPGLRLWLVQPTSEECPHLFYPIICWALVEVALAFDDDDFGAGAMPYVTKGMPKPGYRDTEVRPMIEDEGAISAVDLAYYYGLLWPGEEPDEECRAEALEVMRLRSSLRV